MVVILMTWREDAIQVVRGPKARWLTLNPVIKEGEIAFEKDTGRLKVGNGSSRYSQLDYILPAKDVQDAIEEAVSALPPPSTGGNDGISLQTFTAHVSSPNPHPAYDDGPSFLLAYENAKV